MNALRSPVNGVATWRFRENFVALLLKDKPDGAVGRIRRRNISKMNASTRNKPSRPPTTPPAIAPGFDL